VTRSTRWWAFALIVLTTVTLIAGTAPRGTTLGAGDLVWVTKRNTGSVAVIDPTSNRVIGEVEPSVSAIMQSVAVGAGAVWATDFPGRVYRIDPTSRTILATVPTVTYAGAITAGNGVVWVDNGDLHRVTRIDASTNEVAGHIEFERGIFDVAMTDNAVWVVTEEGHIHRFAPTASRIGQTIEVAGEPNAIAGGAATLWASDLMFGRVLRISAGGVQRIDVGVVSLEAPGIAVGLGSVWVATGENGSVIRIDANTDQQLATIDLGGWVEDVAVGAGAVWAVLPEDALVVRIDPATNQVTARIRVAGFPSAIAVGWDTRRNY